MKDSNRTLDPGKQLGERHPIMQTQENRRVGLQERELLSSANPQKGSNPRERGQF